MGQIEETPNNKTEEFGECEYHLCRKKTKTQTCPHCKKQFCNEHINPTQPTMAIYTLNDVEDRILNENWRKKTGHPCPPYVDVMKKELEERKEKYRKILDYLINTYFPKNEEEKNIKTPLNQKNWKRKKDKKTTKYVDEKDKQTAINKKSIIEIFTNKFMKLLRKLSDFINEKFLYILIILSIVLLLNVVTTYSYIQNTLINTFNYIIEILPYIIGAILYLLFFLYFLYYLTYTIQLVGEFFNIIINLVKQHTAYIKIFVIILILFLILQPTETENTQQIHSKDTHYYLSENQQQADGNLKNNHTKKPTETGTTKDKEENIIDIKKLETNPKNITLIATLRGVKYKINLTLYGGVYNYLQKQPKTLSYYSWSEEGKREFFKMLMENELQQKYIDALIEKIKTLTPNKEDQARLAISMVQNIPYDWEDYFSLDADWKYPYETLYENKGVCGDKSVLLALLLTKLGFGTALFEFEDENHMALGVKCPKEISYKNTGYCFIESTSPTIITYSDGEYIGVGKLRSNPEIIKISDGFSLNAYEEYEDAQLLKELEELAKNNNNYLPMDKWLEWKALVDKYGIH